MARRPFTRALEALRAAIVSGEAASGQALPVMQIAAMLKLSATPVREALAHLAGEGLVEESLGRGYLCRSLTESDYRGLCDLQAQLLAATLDGRSVRDRDTALTTELLQRRTGGAEAAALTGWLFDARVRSAGSACLIEVFAKVSGRLGSARLAEGAVLEGVVEELVDLARSFDAADRATIEIGLRDYSRRRRAAAARVCDHVRARLVSHKDLMLQS